MVDSRLDALNHTTVPLNNGAEIIVLDTGAVLDAEAVAMLQALHSRSTGGLKAHLNTLAKRGPDDFMKNFYVGYNHKSIGDCGTTTVFIEGVSMLAAKAVQDFPLYSGQEASTRYIDFSKQPMVNPSGSAEGAALLEMQRKFYLETNQPTVEHLRKLHPISSGEDEKTYNKAINARAFDVTRCLLPAGAATNLAWHTNLRQAADRMRFLGHHPLEEVRSIAGGLEIALQRHHKNSFGHKKYEETEAYQDQIAAHYLFHDPTSPSQPLVDFKGIDLRELENYRTLFDNRPAKTELPKFLAQLGTLSVNYQLDFGSFRDIQRQRAINQRMPLLTTELGFHEWYVESFPEEVRERLSGHLDAVNAGIESLGVSNEVAQYYIPMGYKTSNRFIGDLPATVYMVELRDTSFVHPTLQKVAHSIAGQIKDSIGIPLHLDPNPGRFNVNRGKQDIVLR
jgi:thymidylate synthase ThyX